MHNKQQIHDFMNAHPLMVIATLSRNNLPESAVVGFGQTDNFQLIFGTSCESRKCQNIEHTDNVSAVIGWDDSGTVQYSGKARQLSAEEADHYTEIYFHKNPTARRFKTDPRERYFLIEPTWLRFTEVAFDPWKITELRF